MKDVVSGLLKVEHVVASFCWRAFSASKEYTALSKRSPFIWCDSISNFYYASWLSVTEISVRPRLDEESQIGGSEKVRKKVTVFGKLMDRISGRRRKMMWEAPPGLFRTQTTSLCMTSFLSNEVKDTLPFERKEQFPLMH